jgi:hypothetical protein
MGIFKIEGKSKGEHKDKKNEALQILCAVL